MAAEKLFDIWAKRNPEWETRYEDSVVKAFCDYGKGTTSYQTSRAKLFGAGYEIFIIAFFIGLYFDKTRPLTTDKSKVKSFGWAIENWGSIEARNGRRPYTQLREYMYIALLAKTDINFIELDKGDITTRKVVDVLIQKMEEYANFGFYFIEDKLNEDPNYFYKETAFLQIFIDFMKDDNQNESTDDEDEADSLD